jgi:primosomal protein N' (replication factor Y)
LTVHRAQRIAACHHCGFTRKPATHCPGCGALLAERGFGTEQIESNVRTLLPAARIARLDRDTASSAKHLRSTVDAWRHGELDVLVGTQMVAKGHDAPGVTLIGVVLADASLHFPDFRAAERTFQLLAQVAGRAGRGHKPGRVLVQTRQPEHPSLIAAQQHDFARFARGELALRADLGYPPFGRLTRIVVEGVAAEVERRATAIARRLIAIAERMDESRRPLILGPAPAPLERLRGRDRTQLLVKAPDAPAMAQILSAAALEKVSGDDSTLRVVVDVDPVNML